MHVFLDPWILDAAHAVCGAGETVVIGDNVYLMHDVTLGATGNSNDHDRHPKISNGVFLGAKATVLGNISIGEGATVAAAAVVTKPVPPGHTAIGMPAKILPPKRPGASMAAARNGGFPKGKA